MRLLVKWLRSLHVDKKTWKMLNQRIINMNIIKFPTCMFMLPKISNFPLSYSIAVMSFSFENFVERILIVIFIAMENTWIPNLKIKVQSLSNTQWVCMLTPITCWVILKRFLDQLKIKLLCAISHLVKLTQWVSIAPTPLKLGPIGKISYFRRFIKIQLVIIWNLFELHMSNLVWYFGLIWSKYLPSSDNPVGKAFH